MYCVVVCCECFLGGLERVFRTRVDRYIGFFVGEGFGGREVDFVVFVGDNYFFVVQF